MRRRSLMILAILAFLAGCSYDNQARTRPVRGPTTGTGDSGNGSGDGGGGSSSGSTSESPPPPPGTGVSFLAFGDWGTGGDDQQEVASAIGSYCSRESCEFVLTLGDNFYSDGVESITDEQWQEKYREIYGSLGLPFYASLGNHDNNGDIQAQIDYSGIDSTWHMPAEEYSFVWPEGSSDPIIEVFVFNSDYPHFRDAETQSWLREAIAASRATWKVLAMHHPIYSNGNHGDDNQENNEFLIPIICNQIDLVVSGHDHNFEYLRSSEDGCPIEQLVIGTGGAGLRDIDPDARSISAAKIHGFGWFQATSSQIVFRMIETDGTTFYSTTWEK